MAKRKPMFSDSNESEGFSNDEGNESDKELQIALQKGLLKTDRINYVAQPKRVSINNRKGLLVKTSEFARNLKWIERMDVTVGKDAVIPETGNEQQVDVDDDFEREIVFVLPDFSYKQAQKSVQIALQKLTKLNVPIFRPNDYFAEMAKSDQHMTKVRKKLDDLQQIKSRRDAARRLREEKKYASKVQKEVLAGRADEKRQLLNAVKKHRKGVTSQLENLLEKPHNKTPKKTFPNKKSRQLRNDKFGFGGQKKRSKGNTKESFANIDSSSKMKNRKKIGRKMGKKRRK